MKPKVYIETTIVSYLTAWPSPEIIMAANQELTREWWKTKRNGFDLFVSQVVLKEARAGDSDAAQRRLEELKDIPRLETTREAESLAAMLAAELQLPPKAGADALHIAISAVNGIDYLLTWNCAHIANATFRLQIEAVCRSAGYEPPVICTPLEMLERREDDD
jgi:predicted nucleic acid-binding protein